jgi:hypothetical protein
MYIPHPSLFFGRFNSFETHPNELLKKYADSRVDFVDCVIVAMSERLNVQTILTVDQRHFRLFRPKHIAFFELKPGSISDVR